MEVGYIEQPFRPRRPLWICHASDPAVPLSDIEQIRSECGALFFGFRKSFIHTSQRTVQNPAFTKDVDREHQSFQRGLQSLGARYILAIVPSLRAFAIALSDNIDRADDLVQQTLLRALANIGSFEPEKRAGLLS